MRVRLPYKKEGDGLFPIVNVVLKHNQKKTPPIEALIDSGASRCSFDAEIAKILDLPLPKENEVVKNVETFAGLIKCRLHTIKVGLNFVEKPFRKDLALEIDFIHEQYFPDNPNKKLLKPAFGILGHKGFFNKLKVSFDSRIGEIELTCDS